MSPARLVEESLRAAVPCTKKAEAVDTESSFTSSPIQKLEWVGKHLHNVPHEFIAALSEAEVVEIERAAENFEASGLPLAMVSPATFPLPQLKSKLIQWKRNLFEGIGFFVLRGLQPQKYNGNRNILIYAGISSYVGEARAVQYKGGPVLTHVIDLSSREDAEKNEDKYVGESNRDVSLPFHTDNGYILSLYSLHSACRGGRTRLASVQSIYNRLIEERPDILQLLQDDWEWDSFDEEQPSFTRPLIFLQNGKVVLNYSRRHFLGTPGHPRNPKLQPLSNERREALDVLETLASDVALTFRFETGDIQYVNNLAILHARESFVNSELDGCRRHLLRMFLKDSRNCWETPAPLKDTMETLYRHDLAIEKFPWSFEPLPYVLSP